MNPEAHVRSCVTTTKLLTNKNQISINLDGSHHWASGVQKKKQKTKKTPPVELRERRRGAATQKYCLRKGGLGVGGNMFCCCAWWRLDEAKARTLITASTPTVTVTVTAAAQDTQRQAEVTENCRHLFFSALIQEVIKSYFFSTFESFWRIPLIHPPRPSSLHNPL